MLSDAMREETEWLQSTPVGALEDLANKDNATRTAIAQRLVAIVANGTALKWRLPSSGPNEPSTGCLASDEK